MIGLLSLKSFIMKTQKLFLIKTLFVLGVVSVFLKIYQNSMIIKRSYQCQRLQQETELLAREKSLLQAQFFTLKNPSRLRIELEEKQQMHALSMEQIVPSYKVIDKSVTSTIDRMMWMS